MPRSPGYAPRRTLVLDAPLAVDGLSVHLAPMRHAMIGRTDGSVRLTDYDIRLLRLLCTEMPMDAVARSLDVSERTLRRHSRALFDKIGAAGRIEAAVWATRNGLL